MNSRAILTIAFLASASASAGAQPHAFTDWRGLWVTRYDYRNGNADTVRQIVDNAASLGVTDLLFQVRGRSDAYYDSQFEPRPLGSTAPATRKRLLRLPSDRRL